MKSISDFALVCIGRFAFKNLSIAFIFTLLVWLLSSVVLITNSIKHSLLSLSEQVPSLVINKQIAGRYRPLYEHDILPLWDVVGVDFVKGRVWGQYKLSLSHTFVTILGLEPYEEAYSKNVTKIATLLDNNLSSSILISNSLKNLLRPYTSADGKVAFLKPDGGYVNLKIGGIYKEESELFSNDVIITDTSNARVLLGLEQGEFTDIILKVANPNEVDFISAKISHSYPHFSVTSKNEIKKDYELLYQYKSAWFLLLFFICFLAFGIILYDRASGLSREQKKEIAILKALGWEINHIIYYNLFESLVLSVFAFLFGLVLALFYVYFLDAPFLKYVFIGYSQLKQTFKLDFVFAFKDLALLFFLSVPFYIAVSIIPAWKNSSKDISELLR